jgi:hypothetical protein
VLVLGLLMMAASAGAGTLLGWETRHTVVHVRLPGFVWTGHVYGVLAVGALLACWFLLGVSFIRCRVAELRRAGASRPRRTGSPAKSVSRARPVHRWTPPKVPAGRNA